MEDCKFKTETPEGGFRCAVTYGECQFTKPGSGLGCSIRGAYIDWTPPEKEDRKDA